LGTYEVLDTKYANRQRVPKNALYRLAQFFDGSHPAEKTKLSQQIYGAYLSPTPIQ